jgi:amidohydrolase
VRQSLLAVILVSGHLGQAAAADRARVEQLLAAIEPQVIEWRRDIHQHPELSNREVRTARLVAEHLQRLGLEVETQIAHTGVVGLLRGALPGPTIALRADMDALPVTEKTEVPFRSQATGTYRGETVGVMHACGHDMHTATLMGVAQTLAQLRSSLRGNVLFIFQPAEEGAPDGEEGGADLMLEHGIFDRYQPRAVIGLHAWSLLRVGEIGYRRGPLLAASDAYRIVVRGKQTHGSRPWQGVDPIVTAAQIVTSLQTVVSRQLDIASSPAVVTVGVIKGGVRNNIIPDIVEMIGTIRTFTDDQRMDVISRVRRIVENTAAANGATATFEISPGGNPVTVNDETLTDRMLPTLRRVAGDANVKVVPLVTGAEDFAFYARRVPGFFFLVGVTPAGEDPATAPANHSDYFFIDEPAMAVGLRAMTALALDYLEANLPQ